MTREALERFTADELYTITIDLMRRIHDECVWAQEPALHADLPCAIDELMTGPWRLLDGAPFWFPWPYLTKCQVLQRLLDRLAAASSGTDADEALLSARYFLSVPNLDRPLWAR